MITLEFATTIFVSLKNTSHLSARRYLLSQNTRYEMKGGNERDSRILQIKGRGGQACTCHPIPGLPASPLPPGREGKTHHEEQEAQELEQELQAEPTPASIINDQIDPFLLEDEWILSRGFSRLR